jgi:hypothetical protein
MSGVRENAPRYSGEASTKQELIYFCEQHGAMNKLTDLKEKANQISRRA